MFLGTSLISWKCKKQPTVSKSSAEAVYRSMSSASSEIIWLQRLLRELGVFLRAPTCLFVDNTSAIHIATNPVFHECTEHWSRLSFHFSACPLWCHSLISYCFIWLVADIFTKAMAKHPHDYLRSKLMLRSAPPQFEGDCKETDSDKKEAEPNKSQTQSKAQFLEE